MKTSRLGFFFAILVLGSACNYAKGVDVLDKLTLVSNGTSEYQIVIPSTASKVQKHAAEELQGFLQKISGAQLPIITDESSLGTAAILLGDNRHLAQLNCKIDFDKLGNEGFTIRTVGNHLVIAGSELRGTLYGVYTFLEDYLGCRWYSSQVSHIPEMPTITLPQIDDTQVPVLDFREVYYADAMDPDFAARLKLNGNATKIKNYKLVSERHNGWGTWCHTMFTFVPPDEYFKDHPEYFSLIGGKRQAKQLCLTNPDIVDITVAKTRELMVHPEDFAPFDAGLRPRTQGPIWADKEDIYWDVSQMDNWDYCKCPDCKAINDREGTPQGSILAFVNKIAAQFPDRTISTLAYQYSIKPPKTIRPAENVSIMLCAIASNRNVPIIDSSFAEDKAFRQNIEDWASISNSLFIWDYVVNFAYLISPNPNLRIQQPNIKFFVDHNAKGVFCQGSREVGGEFCELRNYMLAKLLWNPNADVNAIIDDFLAGYYGSAAESIRQYIDLLHDSAEKAGMPLGIIDHPRRHIKGFLKPELIARYNVIFDQAESLVADNDELLFRVRTARMPVMFAQMELGLGTTDQRAQIINEFAELAKLNNIQRLSEGGGTPERFYKKHLDALEKQRGAQIFPTGGYLHDSANITVKLICEIKDAQLRYTIDGSDPTVSSLLYSSPFILTGPATVKALAFHKDKPLGGVCSVVFQEANVPLESKVMRVEDEAVPVKLSVRGLKQLKLIVNDAGDGIGSDHGNWADAKLIDKDGKVTYLTDLPVVSEKQGWGQLGINKNIAGKTLRIGSKSFAHGLGVHANSEIIYNLDAQYEYFEALIGVDAGANPAASVIFKLTTSEAYPCERPVP